MKIVFSTILIFLSLFSIILNVGPLFIERQITEGQRIYESIRETNANSRNIIINEEHGRSLIKFIENARIEEWRARFFLFSFSFLVLIGTIGFIYFEYRKKSKNKT